MWFLISLIHIALVDFISKSVEMLVMAENRIPLKLIQRLGGGGGGKISTFSNIA